MPCWAGNQTGALKSPKATRSGFSGCVCFWFGRFFSFFGALLVVFEGFRLLEGEELCLAGLGERRSSGRAAISVFLGRFPRNESCDRNPCGFLHCNSEHSGQGKGVRYRRASPSSPDTQLELFQAENHHQQQGPTAEPLPGGSSSGLPGQEKEFLHRLCGLIADLRRSSRWTVRRRLGWRTPRRPLRPGCLTQEVPTALPHVPVVREVTCDLGGGFALPEAPWRRRQPCSGV